MTPREHNAAMVYFRWRGTLRVLRQFRPHR
jgi:hypothetical protein